MNVAVLFASIPVEAALLMESWRWFVLRAFPSAPAIGFVTALGLSIFIGVVLFDLDFAGIWAGRYDVGADRTKARVFALGLTFAMAFAVHLVIGAHA